MLSSDITVRQYNELLLKYGIQKQDPELVLKELISEFDHIDISIETEDHEKVKGKDNGKFIDLNGDGEFNEEDIKILKEYLEGKRELDEEQKKKSDVNEDGKINRLDYVILIRSLEERRKLEARVRELQDLYNSLLAGKESDSVVLGVDNSNIDAVKNQLDDARAKLRLFSG